MACTRPSQPSAAPGRFAAKLCVEVDGQTHWLGEAQARDAWLALRGVRTLRLSASLVFEDLDTALWMIEAKV